MLKYFIPVFLILSLSISCSDRTVTIPQDVLSLKDMSLILTDIHLAQSALSEQSTTDTVKFNMNDYVYFILKQHRVKKEDFIKSLKFYSEKPEMLEQVYDSVITSLSKIQGEMEK